MAVPADRSIGYHNTIGDDEWGQVSRFLGADYGLGKYANTTATDLTVSSVAGADRTLRVTAGTAYGHGIMDTFDTDKQVQGEILSSGIRWDTVVVRRDWANEQSRLDIVPGVVNGPEDVSISIEQTPGFRDDQPIALARLIAGQTSYSQIIQLRHYASKRATLSDLRAWKNAPVGAEADVNGMVYRMSLLADGSKGWRFTSPKFWRGKAWDGSGGIRWPRNTVICPPIYAATDRYAKSINMGPPFAPAIVNPWKSFALAPGGYQFTWQAEWDARLIDGYIAAVRIYVLPASQKLDTNNWWLGPTMAESHPDRFPQFIADGIAPLNAQMANRGTRVRTECFAQIEEGDTVLFATFHDHPTDQLTLRHGENATFCTIQRV